MIALLIVIIKIIAVVDTRQTPAETRPKLLPVGREA
jgi:hypothetical protein